MDNFVLEEDEQYQSQCGEIFFTTKGRLIFHCTLCEKKFQGFNSYGAHVTLEHTPIFNDKQMDEPEPTQCTIELLEKEDSCGFQESVDINEDQLCTSEFLKKEDIEDDLMEEDLEREEISLLELKKRNGVYIKFGEKIIKGGKQNEQIDTAATTTSDKDDTSCTIPKKLKRVSIENLEIPLVVREVKTRFSPRSLLTPVEDRKYKCPVCEVAFKDKHVMLAHFKRHSDNRNHKCNECGKEFYTGTEVRLHMRCHKQERPFLCNICARSYTAKFDLLEHLKRHANERNHKCEVCEKSFFSKAQLMDHMAVHSSDRPYSCNICAASFPRRKTLSNHIKLHENKRAFKCELCDAGFNQRAGLFSHMKTAHKRE